MKTVKDKQVLVAADIAGVALKNAIVAHLESKGWTVTDIGVKTEDEQNPEMFHRIGLKVGAKIAEREFERALIFCGIVLSQLTTDIFIKKNVNSEKA